MPENVYWKSTSFLLKALSVPVTVNSVIQAKLLVLSISFHTSKMG